MHHCLLLTTPLQVKWQVQPDEGDPIERVSIGAAPESCCCLCLSGAKVHLPYSSTYNPS
jgi:hypothetical protein